MKYFSGLEVSHSKKRIFITQHKYILNLLKETEKLGCKPPSAPINPNIQLSTGEDSSPVNREAYKN